MKDLIDRQEAIVAVCESVCEGGLCRFLCPEINALKALPSAQPETTERTTETAQNVSDRDLISRKAAIEIASGFCHPANVAKELEALPSAQPERKRGRWIDDCTCSICHWIHEDDNGFALITKYNYCPNCGTEMEVGDESN